MTPKKKITSIKEKMTLIRRWPPKQKDSSPLLVNIPYHWKLIPVFYLGTYLLAHIPHHISLCGSFSTNLNYSKVFNIHILIPIKFIEFKLIKYLIFVRIVLRGKYQFRLEVNLQKIRSCWSVPGGRDSYGVDFVMVYCNLWDKTVEKISAWL